MLLTTTSEEHWLEERRKRLTSTELATLYLSQNMAAWKELRAEKRGHKTFHGNAATKWGQLREPVLAELLTQTVTGLAYNHAPQTIAVWDDDQRLCGTPDLLPAGDSGRIGEIKTTRKQFTGGRLHDWLPDNYYCQIQANMLFTGASECAVLAERHSDYEPQETEMRIIGRDDELIRNLLEVASQWFAWIDDRVTPAGWGEVASLDEAEELLNHVKAYQDAKQAMDEAKTRMDDAKQHILSITGDSYAGDLPGFTVTVSTTAPRVMFDSASFKQSHPDLFRQFQKTSNPSTRLIVKTADNAA